MGEILNMSCHILILISFLFLSTMGDKVDTGIKEKDVTGSGTRLSEIWTFRLLFI